ncbi:hypothetical protein IKG07_02225 [Candidatus Saccharibacteria bacterium]|nr:hypothetical protein [Candidatus Saccharibacteria bacterium]
MRSIEGIIREASVDDYKIYFEWKDEIGWRSSEPRRFKWVLENPKISLETKQLLIEEVDREGRKLKEEKDYLLGLGEIEPKTHEIRVEGLTSALRYERKREYWRSFVFGMIMLVALGVASLLCIFYPDTLLTKVWRLLALICACLASVAFTDAWTALKDAKKEVCENEAQMMEDSFVGQAVRVQLSCVEEQEINLLDFTDAIMESGMKPSE